MPFKKGVTANPTGNNGYGDTSRQALKKIRSAIDKAVDRLGVIGLSELIAKSMQENLLGTLKACAMYMPKDLTVEDKTTGLAESYTDQQLAELVAAKYAKEHKQASEPGDTIN